MSTLPENAFRAEGFYKKFHPELGPFLEQAGISESVVSDPEATVTLAQQVALLDIAAFRLGDQHLGLHLGLKVSATDLGIIGFAILNSPTIESALTNLSRYLKVYARGCSFELDVARTTASYRYNYLDSSIGIVARRQEAELTLSSVVAIVRDVIGESWFPEAVYFEHPCPAEVSEYKRVFGCPVFFDAGENSVSIKQDSLSQRIERAEGRLLSVIVDHLDQSVVNDRTKSSVTEQVRRKVARLIGDGDFSIDDVADSMNMTRRTLQRRLKDEDCVFSELVDQTKRSIAIDYVEKSNLPLSEITQILGYAHVSTFCRTFKRWTGKTPQMARKRKT